MTVWDWVTYVCFLILITLVLTFSENGLNVQAKTVGQMNRIRRKATPKDSQLWPDGIIPYIITEPLASHFASKEAIVESIEIMERDTCIKFQNIELNLTSAGKHVRFEQANGCHSSVGNTASKDHQVVSIGRTCGYPQMVLHELGHLVGLVHEHCRPDRDAHIMINWDNIKTDMAYNFDKREDARIIAPYDLSSFMHYGLKVFSKNKIHNSIMPLNNDLAFLVGYRPDLSFYDKYTINNLYDCSAECPWHADVCENEGFLDKMCHCICPRLLTGDRCQSVITDPDCGGVEFVGDEKIITTPNYPANYRNNQNCVWFLKTSPDQLLEVTFEDFDVEAGSFGICRDQLEIRAHYIGLDRGRAYCGEHLNDTIISTTNMMMINFHSGSSKTKRGFKAVIKTTPKIDCSSSPCQNDGTCQPLKKFPDYYCQCQEKWIGKNCDILVVNGSFSEWSVWSPCIGSCGLQSRHRECNNPAPRNGGRSCSGKTSEIQRCHPKHINCSEQVICNFEQGSICYGMWITGDKNMAWRTHIGSTPSMNTGPTHGHLSPVDGYLYMESSHGHVKDETVLWLPSQRWTLGIYCIQFYYHLFGQTSGSLRLVRRNPDGIRKHVLWQKSNDRGNKWMEANVNVLLNSDIELGFVGIRGIGYYSDIALDDISVSPGKCNLPRDSYAKGCMVSGVYHHVGHLLHVEGCQKNNCFCNPDGELDCPDWDWEDICGDHDFNDKPKKSRKRKNKGPLKDNKKPLQPDIGSSGSATISIKDLNKKNKSNKKRRRKIVRLRPKKKTPVRLIGSGEA